MKIYLYGPPGSGKSSCARLLADCLDLPFYDLDREIEARSGKPVAEIFSGEGEGAFRRMEQLKLVELVRQESGVIALGGGTLLDPQLRARIETSGALFCLSAESQVLLSRLAAEADHRPLLSPRLEDQLHTLLAAREAHYASFPQQVPTGGRSPQEVAWQIQVSLGYFRLSGMGEAYDVLIRNDSLDDLGQLLRERGLDGPLALVSDPAVAALYAGRALQSLEAAGYACKQAIIAGGEQDKRIDSVNRLWEHFVNAGLERSSTVVALGGGVVSDMAGFAAGTYLRGVRWAAVPTSLLAMVDAGLGGKTGVDLPQGKNLVGLFYPPGLVVSDPQLLATLDSGELRNGMAEVVKHGMIGDPELYARCAGGWQAVSETGWEAVVRQAAAVKVRVLSTDPFERGLRESLNFGHTVGHALELASGYRIQHGAAVAIGMVVETALAEGLGMSEPGLTASLKQALEGLGLPVRIPGWIDREALRCGLRVDKKRRAGKARLSLPVRVGEVRYGFEVEEEFLWEQCLSCMDPT